MLEVWLVVIAAALFIASLVLNLMTRRLCRLPKKQRGHLWVVPTRKPSQRPRPMPPQPDLPLPRPLHRRHG